MEDQLTSMPDACLTHLSSKTLRTAHQHVWTVRAVIRSNGTDSRVTIKVITQMPVTINGRLEDHVLDRVPVTCLPETGDEVGHPSWSAVQANQGQQ